MFNDIFLHKGEVWVKVKYSCKLPLIGFVNPEIPIRMSEDNFKILALRGFPVRKIPVSQLYITPIGKYYNVDILVNQKIEGEFKINNIEKRVLPQQEIQEPEPTIESVVPEKCIPELSSVGDMLEKQIAKDKKAEENLLVEFEEDVLVEEDEIDEDEKPISRNDINRMKKADLHKLLDYLEVEYTEEMVVKELRELALELLGL